MITLRADGATWVDGHLDGLVRDDRVPQPEDGLASGASVSLGDPAGGPSAMLSITRRLFPKKAPTHLHKTDTFRMALGEPITVGRTSYAHGEFRLQQVDTFYGPEYWSDEVGTNQLLIMADRRGGRPFLTNPELQALSDMGRSAEQDLAEGFRQHERDAEVPHEILNNFGATVHAGHWDAGFTDTSAWPLLSDGSRLGVIAFGLPDSGPLLICWDRPAGATPWPAAAFGCDLLTLVVEGSMTLGNRDMERLAFRLQQEGTTSDRVTPGPEGVKALWLLADRRTWEPTLEDVSEAEAALAAEVAGEVDRTLSSPATRSTTAT